MQDPRPICLLSDFGLTGPYVGLMHAVLLRAGVTSQILDVQHDLPAFLPQQSGLLLRALLPGLPANAVVVAVIDPGVGSERAGLILQLDGRTLIGPDNGLFGGLLGQARSIARIEWLPERMSASFHGRDWFAPVAARIALGKPVEQSVLAPGGCVATQPDPWQVIYIDHYGNLLTGLVAADITPDATLRLAGQTLPRLRTFSDAAIGQAFCYVNSLGLLEVAVNQGSAAQRFAMGVGDPVARAPGPPLV